MILTREMAEKAKAFINTSTSFPKEYGVCRAIWAASEECIDIYNMRLDFWGVSQDCTGYRWPLTPEGDIKRRAFIDSLIGKDL